MENCTIYSHYLDFDKIGSLLQASIPKAKLEYHEQEDKKQIIATVKGGLFSKDKTLRISYRQRKRPSFELKQVECPLTQNLAGMCQFIQSIPAQDENIRQLLLQKVVTVNSEIGFVAEPAITPAFLQVLTDITHELDAIVFATPNKAFTKSSGQYFADKNLDLILDTAGLSAVSSLNIQIEAAYKDPPASGYTKAQLHRKERSEALLREHDIRINTHLPCTPDVTEAPIRSLPEVFTRTYALLVVAAKGEGIEQQYLDRVIADKAIREFSPYEKFILEKAELTDGEQAYATWRYEGLAVLLWALGYMDTLDYPSAICDVPALVETLFQPSRADFEAGARLRSAEMILEALDQVYRMNWACVDARVKGTTPGGNLIPGIVYERHYVLNWLTSKVDWDEVSTDT